MNSNTGQGGPFGPRSARTLRLQNATNITVKNNLRNMGLFPGILRMRLRLVSSQVERIGSGFISFTQRSGEKKLGRTAFARAGTSEASRGASADRRGLANGFAKVPGPPAGRRPHRLAPTSPNTTLPTTAAAGPL